MRDHPNPAIKSKLVDIRRRWGGKCRPPRLAAVAMLGGAAVLALALVNPPSAAAGTYRAVQCNQELSAGHPDASYGTTSPRYTRTSECASGGLVVGHDGGSQPTGYGRYGAWTLTAPAGTEITRVGALVAAQGAAGHAPQVFVRTNGGATRSVSGVRGTIHPVSWLGESGRSLTSRLICKRTAGCGEGANARIAMRKMSLTLRDGAAPGLGLSGALLAPGSRRGTRSLAVEAHDPGGGVHALNVQVNGDPVATRAQDCALSGTVALRLRPCPATVETTFQIDTTTPVFRQGPNVVRVCASDYATAARANLECEARTVRIDNLCPVSAVEGASLTARFADGGERVQVAGDPTEVVGSVRDAAGKPLPGARVCVAARVRLKGSEERVIATPTTGADGRFRARVPAGPSRAIRVAHWAGADRAHERHLQLDSRATPHLMLRPRGPIRNGERVRFVVGLPGPGAARRRVIVQTRSAGRWITVDEGRTRRGGAWRGSYRFRSTTGTQRYAFRAMVPRQSGYPYLAGHSRTRHLTVKG